MEPVLQKLQQDFGLSPKHVMIIDALANGPLKADQICDATGIPKGRVYDILNELTRSHLIERSPKRPYNYFVENINHRVIDFMKFRIDNMITAQAEIMDLMKGPGLEQVELISNSQKYTECHLRMIAEGKHFRYLSFHNSFPYALYPMEYRSFMQLRKAIVLARPTITYFDQETAMLVHRSYLDAFTKGKSMSVILERQALDFHMDLIKKKVGGAFFKDWKENLLQRLDAYKLEAYVLDEYIPMQIDINERRVSVSIRHLGITNGVVIMSQEVTNFYNRIFEQHMQRAKSIMTLLKG